MVSAPETLWLDISFCTLRGFCQITYQDRRAGCWAPKIRLRFLIRDWASGWILVNINKSFWHLLYFNFGWKCRSWHKLFKIMRHKRVGFVSVVTFCAGELEYSGLLCFLLKMKDFSFFSGGLITVYFCCTIVPFLGCHETPPPKESVAWHPQKGLRRRLL